MPTEPSSLGYSVASKSLSADAFVEQVEIKLAESPGHVVTAIHGIRDLGLWALDLQHFSRQNGIQIAIEPVSYPWIGAFSFLLRLGAASLEKRVLKDFEAIILRNPHADHSIIAHSNGTKLAAAVIKHLPEKYKYVIFCGSVCKGEDVPLPPASCERLINDCSPIDFWPLIAQALNPYSYEATGVYGFRRSGVEDRFYTVSHGGCLSREHFRTDILPILLRDRLPIGERPQSRMPFQLVAYIRFGLLLLLFVAAYEIIF